MAHNLNENGKRMFYVGEEPWHKLGTKLDNPATAREAIEAARLDYPISLQPIFLENGKLIEDKVATVRDDTDDFLGGIVGPNYRIVQNVEAFSFFDSIVGEGQAIYHTAGALGLGERIWILAKLPKELVIAREDIVEKYLILTNSHNGKSALKMYFSPVRVVCQNTLSMSMRDARQGISIRHTGNIKIKIDEARRLLGIAIKYYDEFGEIAKQLARTSLKKTQVEKFFDDLLFGKGKEEKESSRKLNQKDDLLGLFENGSGNRLKGVRGTAWAAYNAVTEYADHYRTPKGLAKDPTNRLKNIWFGTGARLKSQAYDGILEVAGIKVGMN